MAICADFGSNLVQLGMKKFIFLVVLVGVIILFMGYFLPKLRYGSDETGYVTQNDTSVEEASDVGKIVVSSYKVNPDKSISMYSNFPEIHSSKSIKDKNSCEMLSSAGYYTPENKHLGLFVSKGVTISDFHSSSLLNGYVYILNNSVIITDSPSRSNYDYALQAGPLVYLNGELQALTSANNEPARRILLGTTDSQEVYFFAMYDSQALYSGPKISEIPDYLAEFEKENDIEIVNLINLDGGSASALLAPGISLTELKPIGGYFCVN